MTNSEPVDSSSDLDSIDRELSELFSTSYTRSPSSSDENNNGRTKPSTSASYGTNKIGIASADSRSHQAFTLTRYNRTPPSQKESDKPFTIAYSSKPYGAVGRTHSLNSEGTDSSYTSSPSLSTSDHEEGRKNSEKNLPEINFNAFEGKAEDGGLSAWLIVLAAFWIFFIMVIKTYKF